MYCHFPTRMGYGGDPNKEYYEIVRDSEPKNFGVRGPLVWGRLFHVTGAAGWHCPVLFVPYKGWRDCWKDRDLFAIGAWWWVSGWVKYWLYRRWVNARQEKHYDRQG